MIGLNFRHDIFHFQWRGGTQKVDQNFEIVLNKKWNTFFGMFGGSCRYEGTLITVCSFYYHCRKKLIQFFLHWSLPSLCKWITQKKHFIVNIYTYESLQLSIESKITEVCLLFNHNAANFCRSQKSKCMVNQIIHHFYNGYTYYLS